jgi:outer membrane murein-binding lipoprotein Lpp
MFRSQVKRVAGRSRPSSVTLPNKRFGALAPLAITAGLGFCVATAQADDAASEVSSLKAANAALSSKVDELADKVDKLEANQQKSKAAIDAEIQTIQHDADARDQMLSYKLPLTSGYDPTSGFVIRSADGAFSLRPGLVLDIRNDTTYRQSIPKGGGGEVARTGDDTQSGFDLTRVRLTLAGNYTEALNYFIQFQDDQGSSFGLLDAYLTYRLGENSPFYFKVGQFKDPLWHERNLSEANLLAVDRSLVESLVGGGQTSRVQGAAILYDRDRVRLQGVIHDGFNSVNSKFYDSGGLGAGVGGGNGVTPTNFGATGRAEYLVLGTRNAESHPFKQYDSGFTSLGNKQELLIAGAGADYSEAGANSVFFHTADVQYNNTTGFAFYAAYLGAYRDLNSKQGVAPGNYYDPGFLIQAAYLVTDRLEPFVRYDYTYLAGKSEAASLGVKDHAVQEITVGANYYLYRQNLKFTLDGSWLPDGAPTDTDALGVLKDSGNNEFLLRAQFQLAL